MYGTELSLMLTQYSQNNLNNYKKEGKKERMKNRKK